ncbi:MAG: hypothetical protein GKR94_32400 [Gammaproteobacteria bacterium]|nr:hypothetical protein [Gammaproteobacteria bacterium]
MQCVLEGVRVLDFGSYVAGLLEDERFKTGIDRGGNGTILPERMPAWCAGRTVEAALAAAKVPGGPVHTPQQALDDAHINALGCLKPVQYPAASGPSPLSNYPLNRYATPGDIRRSAPQLSEPTGEVLTEPGYGAAQIQSFTDLRVV